MTACSRSNTAAHQGNQEEPILKNCGRVSHVRTFNHQEEFIFNLKWNWKPLDSFEHDNDIISLYFTKIIVESLLRKSTEVRKK